MENKFLAVNKDYFGLGLKSLDLLIIAQVDEFQRNKCPCYVTNDQFSAILALQRRELVWEIIGIHIPVSAKITGIHSRCWQTNYMYPSILSVAGNKEKATPVTTCLWQSASYMGYPQITCWGLPMRILCSCNGKGER